MIACASGVFSLASFHNSVWPVDGGRLTVCVGIFERRHIKTDGPAK